MNSVYQQSAWTDVKSGQDHVQGHFHEINTCKVHAGLDCVLSSGNMLREHGFKFLTAQSCLFFNELYITDVQTALSHAEVVQQ